MSEPVDWEQKYRELMKDYNERDDKLRSARSLLAGVLDCGTRDVECILDMENDHEGTVDRAKDLESEIGGPLNFGHFVMAVKDISIEEIEDVLDDISQEFMDADKSVASEEIDSLKESFQDIIIDDNYCAWGGVAAYGYYKGNYEDLNHEAQDLFADYVGDGNKDDFVNGLKKIFGEIPEDEPSDEEPED